MERLTKRNERGDADIIVKEERISTEIRCLERAISRLAAYEDTGLEPEEVAEYQNLCDMYVEAGLDARFIQACIDLVKVGVTTEELHELADDIDKAPIPKTSPNAPLTLEELREMGCEHVAAPAGWAEHFKARFERRE